MRDIEFEMMEAMGANPIEVRKEMGLPINNFVQWLAEDTPFDTNIWDVHFDEAVRKVSRKSTTICAMPNARFAYTQDDIDDIVSGKKSRLQVDIYHTNKVRKRTRPDEIGKLDFASKILHFNITEEQKEFLQTAIGYSYEPDENPSKGFITIDEGREILARFEEEIENDR